MIDLGMTQSFLVTEGVIKEALKLIGGQKSTQERLSNVKKPVTFNQHPNAPFC